ncbi:MAG: helix-turn-helix transcriptional regulator [Planctomycetes bacterium]|nr:helix-turn-helix transcriptional regulator [Planctomycetota bacterium]
MAKNRKKLGNAVLLKASRCLKVMAHPVRLRIAEVLDSGGPLPVHAIARQCGLNPTRICGQLRLMLGYGLVSSRRNGKEVLYEIASRQLPNLIDCIRRSCGAGSGEGNV